MLQLVCAALETLIVILFFTIGRKAKCGSSLFPPIHTHGADCRHNQTSLLTKCVPSPPSPVAATPAADAQVACTQVHALFLRMQGSANWNSPHMHEVFYIHTYIPTTFLCVLCSLRA